LLAVDRQIDIVNGVQESAGEGIAYGKVPGQAGSP
jgi:hypothetical protein